MPQPQPHFAPERAIDTIILLLEGGKLTSVNDLTEALVIVGRVTDVIFAELLRQGRADIARNWVVTAIRDLPRTKP